MTNNIIIDDTIVVLLAFFIFLITGIFFTMLELLLHQLSSFKNMDTLSVSILYKAIRRQSIFTNKTLTNNVILKKETMITKEQKKILKIVSLLKEYPNTTIYDILYQTEILVNSLETLDRKSCKTMLFSLEHPEAIKQDNDTFLLPTESAFGLQLYTLYDPNALFRISTTYYYKTKLDVIPKKLTRKDLLESVKNTKLETPIKEFLFTHTLLKQNPKTKKLLLIPFLKEQLKNCKAPYLLFFTIGIFQSLHDYL